MTDIVLFINILCTGIVLANSLMLFFFGNKILSTVFVGVFWFYIFIYLIFFNLSYTGILKEYVYYISEINPRMHLHFFIPVFYALFLFTMANNERFYIIFLCVFIIPIIALFFERSNLFVILYHLIAWGILVFLSIYFQLKKSKNELDKVISLSLMNILLVFLAVFPFIIVNLIVIIFFKKKIIIELMLPSCLAFASLLTLFFSYRGSLVLLNHEYFTNMDFLKKSSITEKRTIIEKISAGLIHEIKNPITAIQSLNQQLITGHSKMPENKVDEYLMIIRDELKRVKKLSDFFLNTYRRTDVLMKEKINIYETIKSVSELLKFEFQKKGVNLILNSTLINMEIQFNAYQLRQVFLNLIYNSIEAESKRIEIYLMENDDAITVFIKDDGEGIDEKNQKKLFSPFFSTKPEGTGMGLIISREIIHENHGSLMCISSKPGETIFSISFKKKEK